MDNIEELAGSVHDRFSLATFVGHLAVDFRDNQSGWENITLYDFLEALSAWLPVADRYYENMGKVLPEKPSWLFFAEMLLAAKIYE